MYKFVLEQINEANGASSASIGGHATRRGSHEADVHVVPLPQGHGAHGPREGQLAVRVVVQALLR